MTGEGKDCHSKKEGNGEEAGNRGSKSKSGVGALGSARVQVAGEFHDGRGTVTHGLNTRTGSST